MKAPAAGARWLLTTGVVALLAGCSLFPNRPMAETWTEPPLMAYERPKIDVPEAPRRSIIKTPEPAGRSGNHVSGRASWFDVGGGLYAAAGPAIRWKGWRGDKVRVCDKDDCVVVKLLDWCQCYRNEPRERIIDLSSDAFRRLSPLSAGLIKVTVERL